MKNISNKTGTCQVCGSEKPMPELMPGFSVKDSLVDLIKSGGKNWDPGSYICLTDLNNYRNLYVQKILEEKKGTLSELDKEVLTA